MSSNNENWLVFGQDNDNNKPQARRNVWPQYGPLQELDSNNLPNLLGQHPAGSDNQTVPGSLLPLRRLPAPQAAILPSSGPLTNIVPWIDDFRAALPSSAPMQRAPPQNTAMWPTRQPQITPSTQSQAWPSGYDAMGPFSSAWLRDQQTLPEMRPLYPTAVSTVGYPQATNAAATLRTSFVGTGAGAGADVMTDGSNRLQHSRGVQNEKENRASPVAPKHVLRNTPEQLEQVRPYAAIPPTYSAVARLGLVPAVTPARAAAESSPTVSTEASKSPVMAIIKHGTSTPAVPTPNSSAYGGAEHTAASVDTHPPTPQSPGPPAPGFGPDRTGYEFELNHNVNLAELNRQKRWAVNQIKSCKENMLFNKTQTTACLVAIDGQLVGPCNAPTLNHYGTEAEAGGLRVTLTVFRGEDSRSGLCEGQDIDSGPVTFPDAVVELRFQIIVPQNVPRGSNVFPPAANSAPSSSSTFSPSTAVYRPPSLRVQHSDTNSTGSSSTYSTNTTAAKSSSTDTSRDSNQRPNSNRMLTGPAPGLSYSPSQPRGGTKSKGRRYDIGFVRIPLRGGIPCRPAYRPITGPDAIDRICAWGGNPYQGVFGDAWLIHMLADGRQVSCQMDDKVLESLVSREGHRRESRPWGLTPADIAQARQIVHSVRGRIASLKSWESAITLLISNHGSQKRLARQCPDLVAMWLLAQENL